MTVPMRGSGLFNERDHVFAMNSRLGYLKTFWAYLLMTPFLVSCGGHSGHGEESQPVAIGAEFSQGLRPRLGLYRSIIGDNDLSPVRSTDAQFVEAFGYVHLGCSAVHLGDNYVLTAGHCAGRVTSDIVYNEACPDNFNITWGRSVDNPQGVKTSHCQRVVMREFSRSADYAVVRMDGGPGVMIAPNFAEPPQVGEAVSIFSHPGGRPLEWSGNCQLVQVDVVGNSLFHSCDTQVGSSGAPILNPDGEIIGIHTHGLADRNGGTKVSNTAIEELYF